MTLEELRTRHPRFTYKSYTAALQGSDLTLTFTYHIDPDLEFHPQVTLHDIDPEQWHRLPEDVRNWWVFHIGLAEMPSYWKTTASPKIVVEAGTLTPTQIEWWHTLFIKGMGEYFYVNQIEFTVPEFLRLSSHGPTTQPQAWSVDFTHDYLVPVGGGKDSTLTVCWFAQHEEDFGVFLLNPTQAAQDVTNAAHPTQVSVATRIIDPKMLSLNEAGYLNGHVPFSAYLAFLSRFAAHLFGYRSVVISNERSSNEGNVVFMGEEINHQYSKTFEFERSFEGYLHAASLVPSQSTSSDPAFFSLVRPLYEVQISKLLTECEGFNHMAPLMRSCNRGQKTNSWCGNCPKCLFTFTSLYPFLPEERVVALFGKNLFEDPELYEEARALLGVADAKPFECVGTHEENMVAFYLSTQKIRAAGQSLPPLLQLVWDNVLSTQSQMDERVERILTGWNSEHQVPQHLEEMIRHALSTT